ncbi:MAG: hypothetical protein JSU70_12450 [Phycisphaerales bacterium]|nr:MAG: hypothetical protein JSU70_12450 [Phycisphaerales bacterium]
MCKKLVLVYLVLVLGLATNTLAQDPAAQDIGNPAIPGSVVTDGVTWEISGSGHDIWDNADDFFYVFRPLAGDGEGYARVVTHPGPHAWSKVGLMIRESTAGGSKNVNIVLTGANGVGTQWRDSTGGGSANTMTGGVSAPVYLRIERIGDLINTYYSPNPAFWIPQHSMTLSMNTNVLIGMCVTSHDDSTLTTVTFDDVNLTAPAYPAAWNLSPPDGVVIDPADGVTLSWMPGDGAASHDVRFGKTSPPDVAVNQAETTYDPGTLDGGAVYYWQIDEVAGDGTVTPGEERMITTVRPGTGSITREVWWNVGGTDIPTLVNDARYPDNPDEVGEVTSMETPWDIADNYGVRLHGYLVPETSGDYTFWVSADDNCRLYLSTTDSPCDAVEIAGHNDWTGARQWYGRGEYKSDPIPLVGGEKYYISAIMNEGGGGDNLAVAWAGPDQPNPPSGDGDASAIISGYYLMPFVQLWATSPNPADGATGVDIAPTLSWTGPAGADSYDVYLNGALVGSTTDTSMAVGPLMMVESYTWSVDVIAGGEVAEGCVWSFSTADNRVIDNFDAYTLIPVAPPGQSQIGGGHTVEAVDPGDADLLVDLRAEDLSDGVATTWPNRGSLEDFTANGAPVVGEVDGVKAATFDGTSWFDGPVTPAGLEGGSDRSVVVVAYNPEIAGEETTVSWAHRGGPDSTNMSFNYGNHDTWGAVGHWGADGDTGWWGSNAPAPAANTWWNLTYTYDGAAIRVYVNGELESLNPVALNTHAGNIIRVAAQGDGTGAGVEGGLNYTGSIAEVRVYDDALTEGEVRYLAGAGDRSVPPAYGPLVAHYEFDSDASDSSGNGYDGTLMGDAAVADGMLSLDGDVDYVDLGDLDVRVAGYTPRSLCFWAKPDTVGGAWSWPVAFGKNGTGQAFFAGRNADDLVAGGYGDDIWINDFWAPDVWHHMCLTYDGATARLYADGELLVASARNWSLNPAVAYIGAQVNPGPNEWWDGLVDDVRIYDIALSDAEVLAVSGLPSANPITDTWSDWGLVTAVGGDGTMKIEAIGLEGLPYFMGDASRDLPFADLTAGDGKALSVWVQGDSGNVAEFMYMTLSDGSGASASVLNDSVDLASGDWQEWNIALDDFEGVDVSDAAQIAIGIAGLDGATADVVAFDDLAVYTGRCMPDLLKPVADLNNDCVVDLADLEIMVGEWGRGILQQDWEHRVAYWDSRYRTNWASEDDSVAVRDGLVAAGYTVVDADELKTWMDARIADGAPSVVVLCRDNAPDTVVESVDADCTLRKYLDAGGKLVFYADIPFWDIGHADGTWDNPGAAGQANILGIGNVDRWDTNNTVTITPTGAGWGLTQTWASLRANDPTGLTVLATDDLGYAAAYVKHYLPGDASRGFVRLYDRTGAELVPVDDIVRAAESKGILVSDLNGDGTVGWPDLYLMLDEWMLETPWPN